MRRAQTGARGSIRRRVKGSRKKEMTGDDKVILTRAEGAIATETSLTAAGKGAVRIDTDLLTVPHECSTLIEI